MPQPARWRRPLIWLVATKPVALFAARWIHHADRLVVRWTAGKTSLTSLVAGLPLVWLTTTGARSGQARTSPLVAIVDGANVVVIASNFGQAHLPAWAHNLRAHPEALITVDGVQRRVRAREAHGDEQARLWQQAVALYPGYRAYAARANRHIPLFVLEPSGITPA